MDPVTRSQVGEPSIVEGRVGSLPRAWLSYSEALESWRTEQVPGSADLAARPARRDAFSRTTGALRLAYAHGQCGDGEHRAQCSCGLPAPVRLARLGDPGGHAAASWAASRHPDCAPRARTCCPVIPWPSSTCPAASSFSLTCTCLDDARRGLHRVSGNVRGRRADRLPRCVLVQPSRSSFSSACCAGAPCILVHLGKEMWSTLPALASAADTHWHDDAQWSTAATARTASCSSCARSTRRARPSQAHRWTSPRAYQSHASS